MSDQVPCFWVEPTDQVEVSLRRYRGSCLGDHCAHSGSGYHDKSVVIERGPAQNYPSYHGDWLAHKDPRWPQQCACGYIFVSQDEWQVNPDELLRRSDTGELVTAYRAPAGAMRHMDWLVGNPGYIVGPDSILLGVKLPDGCWWVVDGPEFKDGVRGKTPWSRSGAIPRVTARPSIDTGSYHGWLTDGVLTKC